MEKTKVDSLMKIQSHFKKYSIAIVISLVITLIVPTEWNIASASNSSNVADIVEKLIPAVVNISTTQKVTKKKRSSVYDSPHEMLREFLEREFGVPEHMRKMSSLGSGFIIAADGYIVTNYHVIKEADEINVMLDNDRNKTYKAKVVGQDQKTDLALLKIDAKHELPYLEFGNSDTARVGENVIAVGNPFGLGGTVTTGIISAKARYITGESFDDYIQTDAAINSGNSGGPLCDSETGKVLGVNSVILSPSGGNVGIGFAIPSSIAQPVIKQLRKKGSIVRGWLGVRVQQVDENIAKGIGMEKPMGALVASIVSKSPASKAGFEIGDVILKFDGREIDTINKLPRIVGETEINKEVKVEIFRNGTVKEIKVKVEKPSDDDPFGDDSEEGDAKVRNNKNSKIVLGLTVSNLNNEVRKIYGIDSTAKGVVVRDMEKNSVFAFTGMRPGDLILAVNQKSIQNVNDFEKAFDDMKRKGKGSAAILVSRKGVNTFVGIELK